MGGPSQPPPGTAHPTPGCRAPGRLPGQRCVRASVSPPGGRTGACGAAGSVVTSSVHGAHSPARHRPGGLHPAALGEQVPPPLPGPPARPAPPWWPGGRKAEGSVSAQAGPGSAGPDKGPHGPRHVRLLSRLRQPFLPGPAALPSPAPPQGQEESEARWQPEAPFARSPSARSRTRKRSGESVPHPPARPGQCSCGLRLRR